MTGQVLTFVPRPAPARKREYVGAGDVLIFPGVVRSVPVSTTKPPAASIHQGLTYTTPEASWPPTTPYRPGF